MYISAVGYCMVAGGIYVESQSDVDISDYTDEDLDKGLSLVFAGGFITTLFWVSYVQ